MSEEEKAEQLDKEVEDYEDEEFSRRADLDAEREKAL
jgi:hypothetical protein